MNKEQVLIDNFDKLGEEYKQKEFERIAKENTRLNKIIDKTKEVIHQMLYEGYFLSDKGFFMPRDEDTEFGARAKELLKILNGKEK